MTNPSARAGRFLHGVAAAVFFFVSSQAALAQTPPPPLGPPPAASPPDNEFALLLWRIGLEVAVKDAFEIVKARAAERGFTLSWPPDFHPASCGDSCVRLLSMRSTEHLDEPNQRHAYAEATVAFEGKRAGLSRRIYVPVQLRVFCSGWVPSGKGRVRLATSTGTPYLGGGNTLEEILDFVMLPANVSGLIESNVRKELKKLPNLSDSLEMGECNSLGVVDELDDWRFDRVVWDTPPPSVPAASTALSEFRGSLEIQAVRRHESAAALADGSDRATFYFYVNGRQLAHPPSLQTVTIAPGETVAMSDLKWSLALDGDDKLQLVVTDDFGQSAWTEFSSQQRFGEGEHLLDTVGTVVVPADQTPDGKPGFRRVREYEVRYRIMMRREGEVDF